MLGGYTNSVPIGGGQQSAIGFTGGDQFGVGGGTDWLSLIMKLLGNKKSPGGSQMLQPTKAPNLVNEIKPIVNQPLDTGGMGSDELERYLIEMLSQGQGNQPSFGIPGYA